MIFYFYLVRQAADLLRSEEVLPFINFQRMQYCFYHVLLFKLQLQYAYRWFTIEVRKNVDVSSFTLPAIVQCNSIPVKSGVFMLR